jgi:hypothetical protein
MQIYWQSCRLVPFGRNDSKRAASESALSFATAPRAHKPHCQQGNSHHNFILCFSQSTLSNATAARVVAHRGGLRNDGMISLSYFKLARWPARVSDERRESTLFAMRSAPRASTQSMAACRWATRSALGNRLNECRPARTTQGPATSAHDDRAPLTNRN